MPVMDPIRQVIRKAAVLPIRIYQKTLSPLLPPACRFEPRCSQYAIEAIMRHGIIKGGILAAWRILRCQPLSAGGFDPVPPLQEN